MSAPHSPPSRARPRCQDGSLGCPGGLDCSPYVPLLGVLSSRYGHDASELRGAVTAALRHAALSTRGRMEELVESCKGLHRCVSSKASRQHI